MSLEIAIQENTNALRELIARLTATGMSQQTAVGTLMHQVAEQAFEKPTAKTMTAAAYVAELDAKADPKAEVVVIDYAKEVKPLLVKVSTTKGRDALVALLAKFGVAKGDALPATVLGDVLVEIKTVLAA